MSETTIRCKRKTARLILITLTVLFILIGCASLYERLGVADEEAEQLAAAHQAQLAEAAAEAVTQFKDELAASGDIKTAAIKAGSSFAWQLATILASGIGAVLSGLLAKWLGTERKVTAALIAGIEKGNKQDVKKSVQAEATAAGIEPILHAKVKALTGV